MTKINHAKYIQNYTQRQNIYIIYIYNRYKVGDTVYPSNLVDNEYLTSSIQVPQALFPHRYVCLYVHIHYKPYSHINMNASIDRCIYISVSVYVLWVCYRISASTHTAINSLMWQNSDYSISGVGMPFQKIDPISEILTIWSQYPHTFTPVSHNFSNELFV